MGVSLYYVSQCSQQIDHITLLCYVYIDVAETEPDRGTPEPAGVKAERTVSRWWETTAGP